MSSWPMPITLGITQTQARELSIGEEIALVDDESSDDVNNLASENSCH